MTNQPSESELFEIASAYLDGELGSDEREAAEANPEIMVVVEEFRGLASSLRAVADGPVPSNRRPTSALRASHIASAGDLFEELYGADAALDLRDELPSNEPVMSAAMAAAPHTTEPTKPNRSLARSLLALAAGCLIIAGIGVGIANLGEDLDETAVEVATADVETTEAAAAAGAAAESDAMADMRAAEEVPASSPDPEMTSADAETESAGDLPYEFTSDDSPEVIDATVHEWLDEGLAEPAVSSLTTVTPELTCAGQLYGSEAIEAVSVVLIDGEATEVVRMFDGDTGFIKLVSLATCVEINSVER